MSVFWRPRGCVLWFDFAELSGDTVYDLSGNNNHGTIYGASWRRGHLVGALEFDGVDDYVEVSDSPSLDITDELTIETFIYYKGYTVYPTIVCKGTQNYRLFFMDDGTIIFRLIIDGEGTGNNCRSVTIIPTNRWVHIVGTYDGSVMKIYINGELDPGYYEITGSITPNNESMIIGNWNDLTNPRPFYGLIAHTRIYNRALTEREIRAHANYLLQKYIAHPPFI